MFTNPPNYPSQALSSSVPQLPATITFSPDSIAGVSTSFTPQFLPGQSGPFIPPPVAGFLSQSLQPHDSLLQSADLNSPTVFRNNVSLALMEIEKLKMVARAVLSSIQSAYQPGSAPQNTRAHINRLHEQLTLTIQMLCQSGVGALPVLGMPEPSVGAPIPALPPVPTEDELLAITTSTLQILYDKVQKSQDSAAVVANLLAPEREKDGTLLRYAIGADNIRKA